MKVRLIWRAHHLRAWQVPRAPDLRPQLGRSLPHVVHHPRPSTSFQRFNLRLQLGRTCWLFNLGAGECTGGGGGSCSAELLQGTGTGAGSCRALAAPTHGVCTGAEGGCALAALTLGTGTGARVDQTSATPTHLWDAGGGSRGGGQDLILAARSSITCIWCSVRFCSSSWWGRATAACSFCMATSSANISANLGFCHHCNKSTADLTKFPWFSAWQQPNAHRNNNTNSGPNTDFKAALLTTLCHSLPCREKQTANSIYEYWYLSGQWRQNLCYQSKK